MKIDKIPAFLGAATLVLSLGACDLQETADETEIQEHIANSNDWADAPKFVQDTLVEIKRNGFGICTGTIVGIDRVVTAEHCVRNRSHLPNDFSIEFKDGSEQIVGAIKSHPTADIAVMKFGRVPFSSGQYPMLVHGSKQGSIVEGDRVIIAGFGRVSNSLPNSGGIKRWGKIMFDRYLGDYSLTDNDGSTLKYSSCYVLEPEACSGIDPACSNVCKGDSGGPVYQWRQGDGWGLIGINSGSNCDGVVGDGSDSFMIAADSRPFIDFILYDL